MSSWFTSPLHLPPTLNTPSMHADTSTCILNTGLRYTSCCTCSTCYSLVTADCLRYTSCWLVMDLKSLSTSFSFSLRFTLMLYY